MSKRKNANSHQIPPGNFNLIENPYRPTWDYDQIEGFKETVEKLHSQGRFRSALDEIFKVLDKYPNHPQALMLAMIVVGESRTGRLQADEPLTEAYILDRRLDPIITVCSDCKTFNWVSQNCLFGDTFESMSTMNPVGLQCYNCGYVICRDCLSKFTPRSEFEFVSTRCPNCGQDKLDTPVYPTGRLPQQMERHEASIVRVIVFREGPIPPDGEYIRKLLEVYSPDTLQSGITLTGIPMSPWPDNIETSVTATIIAMESRGEIPTGSSSSTEFAHIQDEHGTQVYIAKVAQPSVQKAEAAAKARKKAEEVVSQAFAEMLKQQSGKKEKRGFLKRLFGSRKETKQKNIVANHSEERPLASSLKQCKKCGASCLTIGLVACIFSGGGTEHEHTWEPCPESTIVNEKFNGDRLAYLRDIDLMFEEAPGLVRNQDGSLIWADCLEQLAYLEGKIPADPADAHLYKAINIYHKVRAYTLAAIELEKAVALDPTNLHYRNQMAIQNFISDNWQKAEETWIELLQIDPNDADGISNYTAALSQMAEKDPAKAIDYYKKALDLEPDSQRRFRDLGVACQDADRFEEAIIYLKKAITYATEPLDAKSVADFKAKVKDRVATCSIKLGRYAEAVRYWTEALTEADWNEDTKSVILSDLQQAQELVKLLDIDVASPLDTQIQNLIKNHFKRLMKDFGKHQSFVIAKPDYDRLLRSDILAVTKAVVKKELPNSLLDNQHHWQTHRIGDLILIVSTIPTMQIWAARSYFHPSYMEFFDTQLHNVFTQEKKIIVAHWTFCSDGQRTGLHLTLIPKDSKNGLKLLAQDLLTDTEKSQFLL